MGKPRANTPGPVPEDCPSLMPGDAARLASCHELLARACFDIGIKAEGSSKLTSSSLKSDVRW